MTFLDLAAKPHYLIELLLIAFTNCLGQIRNGQLSTNFNLSWFLKNIRKNNSSTNVNIFEKTQNTATHLVRNKKIHP